MIYVWWSRPKPGNCHRQEGGPGSSLLLQRSFTSLFQTLFQLISLLAELNKLLFIQCADYDNIFVPRVDIFQTIIFMLRLSEPLFSALTNDERLDTACVKLQFCFLSLANIQCLVQSSLLHYTLWAQVETYYQEFS
jgi:hypothetical protein